MLLLQLSVPRQFCLNMINWIEQIWMGHALAAFEKKNIKQTISFDPHFFPKFTSCHHFAGENNRVMSYK